MPFHLSGFRGALHRHVLDQVGVVQQDRPARPGADRDDVAIASGALVQECEPATPEVRQAAG